MNVNDATNLILNERYRQKTEEGFTEEHDDGWVKSELSNAACCYAKIAGCYEKWIDLPASSWFLKPGPMWPWNLDWWKPVDQKTCLVKAGALILAELERLLRKEEHEKERNKSTEVPL